MRRQLAGILLGLGMVAGLSAANANQMNQGAYTTELSKAETDMVVIDEVNSEVYQFEKDGIVFISFRITYHYLAETYNLLEANDSKLEAQLTLPAKLTELIGISKTTTELLQIRQEAPFSDIIVITVGTSGTEKETIQAVLDNETLSPVCVDVLCVGREDEATGADTSSS